MMTRGLKSKLKGGTHTLGSWISIGHTAVAEIVARSGFDWVVIDLEHSAIGIGDAAELIQTIDLCGVPALVRLTKNDDAQIKRVMDAGAHGVVVPMVNTPRDAESAVAAVYYPPQGRRGVGLARAQGYGTTFREYVEWLEREAVVIVQIEHIDAVKNLREILSVPSIDGYIVGPYDLSASMGLPGQLDHAEVADAMRRIRETARSLGKPGGVHLVEPDLARLRKLRDEGFSFIAYSVDFRMLDVTCRAAVDSLKER